MEHGSDVGGSQTATWFCISTRMVSRGNTDDVIHYYTISGWLYARLWSPRYHAMHVGFWNDATHSVDDAVEAENREIIRIAGISDTSRVLDAGCGLGSTAVSIGVHTKASVTGVTIVPRQVIEARQYAEKQGVQSRVSFREADYTALPFRDRSFDVVIGVESACYAYPKTAFLAEAYRVLRPGGRLVLADGYMKRPPSSDAKSRALHDEFCTAFELPELIDYRAMSRDIRRVGFRSVRWLDRTRDVVRGTDRFYFRYLAVRYALPVLSLIPFDWARSIVRNAKAARASMGLLSQGYGCYGIFTAVK